MIGQCSRLIVILFCAHLNEEGKNDNMIELYFLIYRIPKMMSQLARERNRSAWKWSLAAIAAWLAAEFFVAFGIGAVYGLGIAFLGWPEKLPGLLSVITYIAALAAAIGSVALVRRKLCSMSDSEEWPLPPPPPRF